MERVKLPTGQMNVLYIKIKTMYAEGVLKPKRIKKTVRAEVFNPPVLCIKLRKAA